MNSTSKYTGCFAPSAKCAGVARFSAATDPTSSNNTPGISFKLLRDNIESASFMAMWTLEGQTDPNFFLNPFSNHVNAPPSGFSFNKDIIALKLLVGKFEKADKDANMVGTSNVSMYNGNGSKVRKVNSPFQLVFQPNPAMTQLCSTNTFVGGTYSCLGKIASGSVLYKIWAVKKPAMTGNASNLELIGKMVSTSKFANSEFMDKYVQFRHVFWQEEVSNLSATNWNNAIHKDGYKYVAGVPKFKSVLPKW